MMIAPAIELGIELKVLAETENSSAAAAATLDGDFTDIETVITYDGIDTGIYSVNAKFESGSVNKKVYVK
jgi:hypothetical protein